MSRRLTLHVGAPKTASSLLQKCLAASEEALANHGTVYLGRDAFDELGERSHRPWRNGRAGDEVLDAVGRDLAHLMDVNAQVVVSHEDLLGNIWSFREGRLYPRAEIALRRIVESAAPDKLRVVLFVRRQDSYLESVYLQLVRVGNVVTFDEFRDELPTLALSWAELLDRITDVVPRSDVVVRYFETVKGAVRPFAERFFRDSLLPVPPTFGFATQRVNRGYSQVALQIALAGNPLLEGADRRRLRNFLDKNFSVATHPRPRLFDDEDKRQILLDAAAENERLHRQYVSSDTPRSPYLPH